MHCTNPVCVDDTCDGECLNNEKKQDREWPWYRYDDNQEDKNEANRNCER
jgi:hypothetical protein